jgi:transcriptional regulator with XRE-family HTH domain
MKAITKRLRILRAERGLTQREVVARSKGKMPSGRYWEIENGYREPTDADLAILADTLKCSPNDIVPQPERASA